MVGFNQAKTVEIQRKRIKGKSKRSPKVTKKSQLLENSTIKDNLPEKLVEAVDHEVHQVSPADEDFSKGRKRKSKVSVKKRKKCSILGNGTNRDNLPENPKELVEDVCQMSSVDKDCTKVMKSKAKKSAKKRKKSQLPEIEASQDNLEEKLEEPVEDEVYQMSSGDEDCSKGMKKWITQYYQNRPGIKVLQERIDNFIMAHEEEEDKVKKEKEAQAAEGGWTVVTHHKGRKKSTEAETGVAVGSVAQAAVLDKMSKKKIKDAGVDFYRFQKREAKQNELLMLQSKFEQDKKKIEQMRAARKFKPY